MHLGCFLDTTRPVRQRISQASQQPFEEAMRPSTIDTLSVAMALLTGLGFAQASSAVIFTGLGDLPGGEFHSRPFGVSGDGSIVVGWSISDGTSGDGREAFRWSAAEGMVALGHLPGGVGYSEALGISDDGKVIVGGSDSPLGNQPVRWTSGDGWVSLGWADPFAPGDLVARDVSGDGSVIAGMGATPFGGQAFRWTATGGMVPLENPLGGFRSVLGAISDDGSVIVGNRYSVSGTSEAFRWTLEDGMVGLGDLPGGTSQSSQPGVSPDGSIVVGASISGAGYEAFRWTATTGMVGLGDLVAVNFASGASGVSGNGAIVGHSGFDTDAHQQAFIWDEQNGMRSLQDVLAIDFGLDLTGWSLRHATAISSDGLTIVGYGHNPDGFWEAWVVVLRPDCSDGFDNDDDGFVDFMADDDEDGISDPPGDPGCHDAAWPTENPACQDGLNNDQNAGIDFDGGLSYWGVAVDEADPQCAGSPWRRREAWSCGLGFEISLCLCAFGWLHGRIRLRRGPIKQKASGTVP